MSPEPTAPPVDRAVVVGASLAGLLAAAVLREHAREVVVVERDDLPTGATGRRGVPQGRHLHALLARGRDVLEQLLPGYTDDVVRRGGRTGDLAGDTRLYTHGGFLARYDSGMRVLMASRPLLETVARERVAALPGVRLDGGTDVTGLRADAGRVTGVDTRTPDGRAGHLPADLVVSAGGRSGASVRWLGELGYPLPREERVEVDITYVTRAFRRRPGDLDGAPFFAVADDPPGRRSLGMAAQEGDRWLVTLVGHLGERPPRDLEGFRRYAASLPTPEVGRLLAGAEPVGEAAVAHFPASRRRRFEDLDDLPGGYVVLGDGISSFNPVYAQGVTVAAEQALALGRELGQGLDGLPRRYFVAAAKAVAVPWALAARGDLRFTEASGRRPTQARLVNAYMTRLFAAARHDPVVAHAFHRATNLLDGPAALVRPRVAVRVLAGGARRRRRAA